MRGPHAFPFAVAIAIAGLLAATPVEAAAKAQTAGMTVPAGGQKQATESDDLDQVTTGSTAMTPAEMRKKRYEDCMAIWEPATHMTKRQWRRTCKTQLDEIRSP